MVLPLIISALIFLIARSYNQNHITLCEAVANFAVTDSEYCSVGELNRYGVTEIVAALETPLYRITFYLSKLAAIGGVFFSWRLGWMFVVGWLLFLLFAAVSTVFLCRILKASPQLTKLYEVVERKRKVCSRQGRGELHLLYVFLREQINTLALLFSEQGIDVAGLRQASIASRRNSKSEQAVPPKSDRSGG